MTPRAIVRGNVAHYRHDQAGAALAHARSFEELVQGYFSQTATDLDWKLFMAKLVQSSKATVVPVYFPGQNSRLFQVVSQFSLTLRLSLVIREVNDRIGKPLRVVVGNPISYDNLAHIEGRQALTDHLRRCTYALANEV